MKAIWKNTVIAESNETVVIEGNHYFPAESVDNGLLTDSDTTSHCPWKGTANYYNIEVNDEANKDAAWYYAEPLDAASEIRGRVAFWKGVQVTE
jgi:uncharacterized protein (DUF427 family)